MWLGMEPTSFWLQRDSYAISHMKLSKCDITLSALQGGTLCFYGCNFRSIDQIGTKFVTNQLYFILNVVS